MLKFRPLEPRHTAGLRLQSIRIHVRDHKLRELSVDDRTLEAHYGSFNPANPARDRHVNYLQLLAPLILKDLLAPPRLGRTPCDLVLVVRH